MGAVSKAIQRMGSRGPAARREKKFGGQFGNALRKIAQ
jgi:hypothetical protein